MSNRSRNQSDKSNRSSVSTIAQVSGEMEYFWSIELNADKRSVMWSASTEDLEEDDDEDFIRHTVFLRAVVLGADAVPNQQNVVMLESTGGDGETIKGALANLVRGQNHMSSIDISLAGRVGGTFTLAEGSGPVFISGNHLMECPRDDDSILDDSQECELSPDDLDISGMEKEEGDDDEEDEDEEEEDSKGRKGSKRKATPVSSKQKQKAKMEVDEDEVDQDDEDDDEEEEEEDDEDDEEVTFKKGKKAKEAAKKHDKGKAKLVKTTSRKAARKIKK